HREHHDDPEQLRGAGDRAGAPPAVPARERQAHGSENAREAVILEHRASAWLVGEGAGGGVFLQAFHAVLPASMKSTAPTSATCGWLNCIRPTCRGCCW